MSANTLANSFAGGTVDPDTLVVAWVHRIMRNVDSTLTQMLDDRVMDEREDR